MNSDTKNPVATNRAMGKAGAAKAMCSVIVKKENAALPIGKNEPTSQHSANAEAAAGMNSSPSLAEINPVSFSEAICILSFST
jgi:hypothetical protein